MQVEFRNGIQVLREHEAKPRLTTGSLELDSLLAGRVELGTFTLFYGDEERFIDRLLYNLLCNCQLPQERYGFDGKAVMLNCGNYRQEQALLDLELGSCGRHALHVRCRLSLPAGQGERIRFVRHLLREEPSSGIWLR
jgi:hypothetical protein